MKETILNYLRKYALQLVAVGVILIGTMGWRLINSGSTAKEWREEMTKLCTDDGECKKVVDNHFETCFDDNYSARLDYNSNLAKMVSCINKAAGEAIFSIR